MVICCLLLFLSLVCGGWPSRISLLGWLVSTMWMICLFVFCMWFVLLFLLLILLFGGFVRWCCCGVCGDCVV